MTFYFHFIQSVLVISNRGRYRSLGSGRGQASSSRTRIYLKAYRKVVDIGDQTQYLWTRRQTPSLLSSPQDRIYTTHPETKPVVWSFLSQMWICGTETDETRNWFNWFWMWRTWSTCRTSGRNNIRSHTGNGFNGFNHSHYSQEE